MTNFIDALAGVDDVLANVVADVVEGLRVATDADVLGVLAAAGRVRRLVDAAMVEAVAVIVERDEAVSHADRATTRYGCRSTAELVQRVTRVSGRTAGDVVAAAQAVRRSVAPSSGEVLPAEFPGMRDALLSGDAGLDGVVAVSGVFRGSLGGRAGILAADEELAAVAQGRAADAGGSVSADELRAMARVWAVFLDPDGSEPVDTRALRKRGLTVGRRGSDGLVPVRGGLLPEVAAQLQLGLDSVLNPKVDVSGPRFVETDDGDGPFEDAADTRTAGQKRHDALAILLAAAAASGELPMLGGAAPTLVVQVREDDLSAGRGWAHLPGYDEPISIGVARQVACAGVVERVVLGEGGRIVSLTTLDRVFSHHQRRAITLRDGGCVIPGCDVPPQWCEIHHVQEHSRGGPTHTDNGVLLCWFHHRTIETGGWQIRMVDGTPHVRGPYWWDAERAWRPATKSPIRRQNQLPLRM
ncbi:DUF222 domain-containing protein [Microbacterium sp. NEAU-LLC]|uniref:DUF222 domain-containing protein n=1 Tax=Microbacterium helvum TaxID=2773713 RepID=A0ABR8NN97_9MICO|nr:HNH endonuclease signature motif containing protein [Microbacterium helvum]MBD3942121.1 DUF222 domain-containing protein [Microbacterium helvum]